MQIAELIASNEPPTGGVALSPSAAASAFAQLFGKLTQGEIVGGQTSAPADLKATMMVGGQSGDGSDATALDPSDAALMFALLGGAGVPLLQPPVPAPVLTGAKSDRLPTFGFLTTRPGATAEGVATVSTPPSGARAAGPQRALTFAGAFELGALPQSVDAEETPPVAARPQTIQQPLAAEQLKAVAASSRPATDAIAPTLAPLPDGAPQGLGQPDSARLTSLVKAETSTRPIDETPLRATPSVVSDGGTEAALSREDPRALAALPASGGQTGGGQGEARPAAAPARLVQGPALSRIEGRLVAPPVTTEPARVRLGPSEPSEATAGAAANSVEVAGPYDRPSGRVAEEATATVGPPRALTDRPAAVQERPSLSAERDDGSLKVSSPASGSGHDHGAGPASAGLSSARADAPRLGASAVVERDRSLVEQVTQQIVAAARLGLREDHVGVRLRLRPESLGELLITVSWKEKGLVAAIQAASPVTAKMLQEDLGHLKAALGERGIAVNDLGVQVGLDLQHGHAHGDRLPPTTPSAGAPEARPWYSRDERLPLAGLIKSEGLIDIRV